MTPPTVPAASPARDVLFFATPALWPCWPLLSVVRRTAGAEELGLLGMAGRQRRESRVVRSTLASLKQLDRRGS